jgi:DNA-binding transcriptional regulator YhcF (GntR family)
VTKAAPPALAIPVDRTSPVPLYFQVAQHLERAIAGGELAPGTRLENEIMLADQLGLSRPTMRRAIQYLVDRGLLVRKRGVGTQVVQSKVRRPVVLTSLYDDLDKSGQRTRSRTPSGSPTAPTSTTCGGYASPTTSRSPCCATTCRPATSPSTARPCTTTASTSSCAPPGGS